MRRALIIVGALILLVIVGIAIYFLFFANKGGPVTATPGSQFPGGGGEFEGGGNTPDVGASQEAGDEVAPHLVKITDGPVSFGAVATTTYEVIELPGEGTSTPETVVVRDLEVRYIERASGNIYAYRMNERTLTRLSNRTIPGIQDAAWIPDGLTAFVRYLGSTGATETYALPAGDEEGFPLERSLSQVFVTGSSTVVTLLSGANGSIATAARADGTNVRTIFTSLLSSLIAYPAGSGYAVATKASAQADGYAFMVRGEALERMLGPLKALTILPSPSGKFVLYTYLSGNAMKSALYDTTTHAATALPVTAMPEKCVWSSDEAALYCGIPRSLSGTWPDDWYQGVTHFTDRLWRIDLDGRVASLIVDPKLVANVEIDAVALTLDKNTDALVFTNKSDGSLWLYDL